MFVISKNNVGNPFRLRFVRHTVHQEPRCIYAENVVTGTSPNYEEQFECGVAAYASEASVHQFDSSEKYGPLSRIKFYRFGFYLESDKEHENQIHMFKYVEFREDGSMWGVPATPVSEDKPARWSAMVE